MVGEDTGDTLVAVINLPRECVDVLAWRGVQDQIEHAILAGGKQIVVVGREVRKFSSLGLGTLSAYSNRMRNLGGVLVLRDFSKQARRPFEICRIEKSFVP